MIDNETHHTNIRFAKNSLKAQEAWRILHSVEVHENYRSMNEFIVEAIVSYAERELQHQNFGINMSIDELADKLAEKLVSKGIDVVENVPKVEITSTFCRKFSR